MTPPRPRRAKLLGLAILVPAQLLAIVVLLELGLRIVAPYSRDLRSALYEPAALSEYNAVSSIEELMDLSPLGWRPYTEWAGFVLNSRSFRTPEYSDSPPAGSYRIVTIGDSFTFDSGGVPFAEHWTTELGRLLSDESASKVDVVNLGSAGIGPQFSLRVLQLEGALLEPDLVIFSLFVGNDFLDDQLLAGVESIRPLTWQDKVVRWSTLARLLRFLYRLDADVAIDIPENIRIASADHPAEGLGRGGYEIPGYRDQYDSAAPYLEEDAFLNIEQTWMLLFTSYQRDNFDRLMAVVAGTISAMFEESQRAGADFVLVMIPNEAQVDSDLMAQVAERSGLALEDYDIELPQKRLAEFCESRGMHCLDLLPALRRESERRPLYRMRNTHWNRAGNQVAAEELKAFLRNRLGGRPAP